MRLGEPEKAKIRELIERMEKSTGVQVLAAVTHKSDVYTEVPWKAFSLGTALAALALAAVMSLAVGFRSVPPLLWGTMVLGTGMVFALASIFLPPVARAFLGRERVREETKQYGQSLFLERGLSRTQSRRALLILVSELERRAAIVADTGIVDRIPQSELENVMNVMDAALIREKPSTALAAGLSCLEALLLRRGFAGAGGPDEIADEFLETEGPKS